MKERNRDIRLFLYTLFLVILVTFGFWMLSHALSNLAVLYKGEATSNYQIAKMKRMVADMRRDLEYIPRQVVTKTSSLEDSLDTPTLMRLRKIKPIYKFSKADVQCLARNIYYEAGVESDLGKYAVAQVTLNRALSQHFPNTICGVVHFKVKGTCAFSWVCMNKEQPKGALWRRSQEIAEDFAEHGVRLVTVGNAKFYHATYIKTPYWAKKMDKIATIDQHIFY